MNRILDESGQKSIYIKICKKNLTQSKLVMKRWLVSSKLF